MRARAWCVLLLCLFYILDFCHGGQVGKMNSRRLIKYRAKQNNDITIKILVHMDQPLVKKLARHLHSNTRKKLQAVTHGVLEDVKKIFSHPSLNQTIKFKLIATKFFTRSGVALNENAPKYLKNYCDWQSKKKILSRTQYYSVLLTGVDLFHVNDNGNKLNTSSGRSYTRGICNARKSCAIIEWDPKVTGFLVAHELGHSLGMRHDAAPYNECSGEHVMAPSVSLRAPPAAWSRCSRQALQLFLRTTKSSCVRTQESEVKFESAV